MNNETPKRNWNEIKANLKKRLASMINGDLFQEQNRKMGLLEKLQLKPIASKEELYKRLSAL